MPSKRKKFAKDGKTPLLKVILLGSGNVGKTSLMNRFISNKFDVNSYHTIGVEFLTKDVILPNERVYTLQIWDTAGQERFQSLRTPYYRGADCCLLTFGVDDFESFKQLPLWKEEFLKYADVQDAGNFPFVVLGNKIDIDDRKVDMETALSWCTENGIPYYETSAKTAENVEEAFLGVTSRIDSVEQGIKSNFFADNVNLEQKGVTGNNASNTCC